MEFLEAAAKGDRKAMIQIAQAKLKSARTVAEKKRWKTRIDALEAGRELKFGRGHLKEVH